jgi:hypothetical protein
LLAAAAITGCAVTTDQLNNISAIKNELKTVNVFPAFTINFFVFCFEFFHEKTECWGFFIASLLPQFPSLCRRLNYAVKQ